MHFVRGDIENVITRLIRAKNRCQDLSVHYTCVYLVTVATGFMVDHLFEYSSGRGRAHVHVCMCVRILFSVVFRCIQMSFGRPITLSGSPKH